MGKNLIIAGLIVALTGTISILSWVYGGAYGVMLAEKKSKESTKTETEES